MLETYLYYGKKQTHFSFRSIIDSGADFCVFPAKFGELLGVEIEKGDIVTSFGVGGKEILYFHDFKTGVIIKNEIWKFKCRACFSYKMNSKGTGLLGRQGFFDLFTEISFNQRKRMFRFKEILEEDLEKEDL